MPPTTNPFRVLRAIPRVHAVIPRSFVTLPRQFIPKAPVFTCSIQTFSSFQPRSSTETRISERKPLYESAENQLQASHGADVPSYQLTFTCKPCSTRSSHKISKQGYHKGSVLITCPECRNRHVISDHLNACVTRIFGDKAVTVEELMKERGELVKRGTLSEDGDVEFWEDGTTTPHLKSGSNSK